jgi:hypothetical protein
MVGAVGRRGGRLARRVGWTLLSLVLATLLFAVSLPVVVRGPVLAHLVEHASRNLCGTARVEGGHVSLNLALALLRQRPFEVVLEGARIREPDGNDMFRAGRVRARLTVHRGPMRVVVESLQVSDGKWRLVDSGRGEPLTQALSKIPPGGRDACRVPAAPQPPSGESQASGKSQPSVGSKERSLLTVQAVELQRMSILLSFPFWSVALEGVDARGTAELRDSREGTQPLFDVRGVSARQGGSLRVGPRGESTPVFPFDHVDIPRVAVTAATPQDLLLIVDQATTADAGLSGKARFTNVFVPGARNASAGIELDARWSNIGRALERSSGWADLGRGLARQRTTLNTSLRGPFDALTGLATLRGRDFSLRVDLLPRSRYALDVKLDKLDTTPFVSAGRQTLLVGRLDGRLSLSADLGDAERGPAASLDAVELAFQRTRPGGGGDDLPGRWVVSRSFRPRASDEARLDLGQVGYRDDALRIEAFRVAAPSVQVAGGVRVERRAGSGALDVRAWTKSGSRVAWRNETFLLPPRLAAHVVPGQVVTVDPLSIEHVGGGAIDLGGKARFDGPLKLQVAVRAYPLAHIPGLSSARAPGHNASVGALLRGQVDASLAVGGRPQRPSLNGRLALSHVVWAHHPLGGGRVDFTPLPGATRFQGRLLDGIDVQGTLHDSPRAEDEVTVALRDFALRSWMPPRIAPLDPRVSGQMSWRRTGERAEVRASSLVVSARGARAEATGLLRIDGEDFGASPLEATFKARVDGRALTAALYPKLTGAGTASVDATIGGTAGAPEVRAQAQFQGLAVNWPESPFGAVRLDGPVKVDGRTLAVGPLQANLQSGGQVQIAGARGGGVIVLAQRGAPLPVSSVDLTLRASGISTVRPVAGLSLKGLALGLRLTQPNPEALKAEGSVYLGQNFFQINRVNRGEGKKEPPPKAAAPAPQGPRLADCVSLHLRVVGPKDAVTIGLPYAPDVSIQANCLVEGSLASPRPSGKVEGSGAFSRAAVTVADWFTSRDLRKCDLGPH